MCRAGFQELSTPTLSSWLALELGSIPTGFSLLGQWPKPTWERKRFNWLTHPNHSHWGKSGQELKQEQNQEPWRMLLTGLFLRLSQPALRHPGPPGQGWEGSQWVDWCRHQLAIYKMPHWAGERWFSGQEHLLLLQRTWVQFQEPTWCLTTLWNTRLKWRGLRGGVFVTTTAIGAMIQRSQEGSSVQYD